MQRVFSERDKEYVPCAICGDSHPRFLLSHSAFRIVRCARCGLVFVNPRLRLPLIESEYGPQFDGFDPKHTGKKLRTARKLICQIERFKKKGRLLEIGCGTGNFLQTALEKNWEVEGTEISDFAVRVVHDKLGIKIHRGPIERLPLQPASFDVVCLFEVIEHLTHPLASMRRVAQLLRPGGLLALSTPNIETLVFKYVGKKYYQYFPTGHLYYFSPLTLKHLLQTAGFEIIEIRTKNEDISLLFRRILSTFGVCALHQEEGSAERGDSVAFRVAKALFYRLFAAVVRKIVIPITGSGRQITLFAKRR